MPRGEERSPVAVDPASLANFRVDCYVRSAVPAALSETIDEVASRLERLDERDRIDAARIRSWPPTVRTAAAGRPTLDDLVSRFERWAARRGYSLEPGFRRETIPPSPLEIGDEEPRERVRVPIVSLALYEDETRDENETRDEREDERVNETVGENETWDERANGENEGEGTKTLRGVVPYTDGSEAGANRTYTVEEWLAAVERGSRRAAAHTTRRERATCVESKY